MKGPINSNNRFSVVKPNPNGHRYCKPSGRVNQVQKPSRPNTAINRLRMGRRGIMLVPEKAYFFLAFAFLSGFCFTTGAGIG
ncbi:MAG: hypothetical protein ACKO9H_10740, partial [Planctomycetota bacterium]